MTDDMPPLSWIEAMEARRYQTAAEDDAVRRAWREDGDAVAHALVLLAAGYLDEAQGAPAAAADKFTQVGQVLSEGDDWKATTLAQHAAQCLEYLDQERPLPPLPSGL